MTELEVRTPQSRGMLTMSEKPLGKGGEGTVHAVLSHSVVGLPPAEELVVKVYHEPREGNRREKIVSMVSSPPHSEMFAWPLALVARNGAFVGFAMERLRPDRMKEWARLSHASTRKEVAPEFDVRYAIAACLNLAIATSSAHEAGHRLGDILNESNAAVGTDASIILLDTDSAQIQSPEGRIFRCEVGKPEYLAPELIGRPLKDQDRTVATDSFAYGVLFFQMLTGGAHPTDGIYKGADDPASTISRISQDIYPMLRDESARSYTPVPRIPAAAIPSRLRTLLLSLSASAPEQRASFESAITVIQDVQENLIQCEVDRAHWFDGRDGACGWCAHADSGQPDPWGKSRKFMAQSKLPPVSFGEQKAPAGRAPRAPVGGPRSSPPQSSSGHQSQNAYGRTRPAQQPQSAAQPPTQIGNGPMSPLAQQLLNQANGQAANSAPAQIPSQGYAGSSTPSQQSTQAAPPPRPQKIRGKMVVSYQDGTYGPRPPLGTLFNQSPRIWRQAIAMEWPGLLKLWWPEDRSLPRPLAIWLSPLLMGAALTLILWLFDSFLFAGADPTVLQFGVPLVSAGVGCAAVAFLIWWINCWVGRAKAVKYYGPASGLVHENSVLTLMRSLVISIAYVLTPVAATVALLIVLVKTAIRGDR